MVNMGNRRKVEEYSQIGALNAQSENNSEFAAEDQLTNFSLNLVREG